MLILESIVAACQVSCSEKLGGYTSHNIFLLFYYKLIQELTFSLITILIFFYVLFPNLNDEFMNWAGFGGIRSSRKLNSFLGTKLLEEKYKLIMF